MEVHHHSHTARKKWTHYFWEFLMLFLAVFAGFLAENQREHYIEHQRARAYAKSLLTDLEADTAEINTAILQESITDLMIDSLVIFIGSSNIYENGASLYYYMRKAGGFYGVDWRRATMNQLINSGNLRYFTNYDLVNLISSYNSSVDVITTQENGTLSNRDRATSFRDRIFKAEIYLNSLNKLSPDSLPISRNLLLDPGVNWPVMNRDPELINSYANALIGTKAFRKRLIRLYYPQARTEAIRIMMLLKRNTIFNKSIMEVHHHSHTSRIKWSHYFWEFLMLFLAVFCGFLAEYQLEHKIEKDREKQYIHSILEDLREDTLVLADNIQEFNAHLKRNDTLLRLLNSPDIKEHGSDLYYLGRRASRSVRLAIHDATIQQLKNAGGLRLIRNQKVSKAVIEYYNRLVFIEYLQAIAFNEADEYRKMAIDVFHPVLFNDIVNAADNSVMRPPGNPALLTYDPKTLMRISGMISYIRNTKLGLAKEETEMKDAAKALIGLIKKEYHLE